MKPTYINYLIILFSFFVSFKIQAMDCPDSMPIDQLVVDKTFITIVDVKNLKNKISFYNCKSGKCFQEKILQIKDFLHFGRYISMTIQDALSDKLLNNTYVLKEIDYSFSKNNRADEAIYVFKNINFINLDESKTYARSEIHFFQKRSSFDLKDTAINLGSLKYNLGSQFSIKAECSNK